MTIAVSAIMDETRRILQDRGVREHQRNKDADLRGALRIVLADMRRMRPDIFTDLDVLPDPYATDTLYIEAWLLSPMVFLLAGYIMMQNDEFSESGAAGALIAAGKAQLGTPQ